MLKRKGIDETSVENGKTFKSKSLTRRAVLTMAGAAGTVLISQGLFRKVNGVSGVSSDVYGRENAVADSYRNEIGAPGRMVSMKLCESIHVKDFGAIGDGLTDDTDAILNAIAACPAGGTIMIPSAHIFRVRGLVINKPIKISGGGTLKFVDHPELPAVLQAMETIEVENIIIDGNSQALSSSYTGTGFGLHNKGNRSYFMNVQFNNTKFHGFWNDGAHHVTLNKCYSENAGYSGFRNSHGDFFQLLNSEALHFKFKGFSHNGNSKLITVENFVAITDSLENGVDPVLIDPNNYFVEHLLLRNIYIKGANRSNSIKIIDVGTAVFDTIKALSPNTLYAIHCYTRVDRLTLRNVECVGRTSLKDVKQLVIENCTFDAEQHEEQEITITHPLSVQAEYVTVRGMTVIGGTGTGMSIHLAALKKAMIRDMIYRAVNPSLNMIGLTNLAGANPNHKKIVVKEYVIEEGNDVASAGSKYHIEDSSTEYVLKSANGTRHSLRIGDDGEWAIVPL
ncbi:glycoside hydrolase family protein [Paenibacillus oceani]|uniref:Pectate lyase superfamily protein domain-containing protein n=1 Tax=Paenibacillus oceani TaxID=2772510 RepID=A0A927C822_9BACL|nr:hypothetical protein [Paenibacillus oceani]MBD2861456.1 hypothetical protein [Paenibacillus oceani]